METNFKKKIQKLERNLENQMMDLGKKRNPGLTKNLDFLILPQLKCHECLVFTRNSNFFHGNENPKYRRGLANIFSILLFSSAK